MDNKENVNTLILQAIQLSHSANMGGFASTQKLVEIYAIEIDDLYKPSKVKLPKAAYDWMEERKDCLNNDFESEVYTLPDKLKLMSPMLRHFYQQPGAMFLLVDAYRYGYELEETEEERIKRGIREILQVDAGVMVDDDLVNRIYETVRGDKS